ncbi:hypothetical protein MB02_17030 [Croceicoccus estronivorus]|uniref:TorF family putative porin n=1 Tax=Croceicoccus estronivorus TaxID=1172626 RepID=UPI0008296653|nr:TorF family putative porin [Croceicoccus estronivorus]OCC22413.1 hypothetical protein MB02_17030 [Croceicoccus estronivorus]
MILWKKASLVGAALVTGATAMAGPALADELPVKITGGVTFLTDYRLRGASLSDTEPVIQGSVEASVPLSEQVSVFAGVWGSSLDKDAGAGSMETDLYAGLQGSFGDVSVRARYLRLVFHDAKDIDFDQFEVGLSAPVGPFSIGVGGVHDEYNGGGHSTYVYSSASYPIADTGFAVKGLVGYEDGTNWDDKVNWSLGLSYSKGPFVVGADYIDTNRFSAASDGKNRAGGTVVAYVGGRF